MTTKNKTRDIGALKNGFLISALSACVMLGAVGAYRLTSSNKDNRNAVSQEVHGAESNVTYNDPSTDTANSKDISTDK